MLTTRFAHTGRDVSRIGFGAMGLAGTFGAIEDNDAVHSLLHALERGVTFIDTARGYGRSEELIGRALREWKGAAPFIATKVRTMGPPSQWGLPPPVEQAFPRGHITADAEESLRALGVERLDLLQLHLYWPNWGVDGYWLDELRALKASGKVGAIGVSLPDQRHDVGLPLVMSGAIDSVQTVMNIFDPLALDSLVPICRERGVAVIARCVLDEGGLTGTLTPETTFGERDYRRSFFACVPREMYIERVNRLRKFVPQHARTLAALALKFVLHDPGVTTAISSMHIPRFADENIAAAEEAPLTEEVFTEIRRYHRWVRNFYDNKFW